MQTISKVVTQELRQEDTLARIGGDEFTIIIEKILIVIEKDIVLEADKLNISASIGISIYPDNATDKQAMMKHSDEAMYKAKKSKTHIESYKI